MPAYIVFLRERKFAKLQSETRWRKVELTLYGGPIKVFATKARFVTLPSRDAACAGQESPTDRGASHQRLDWETGPSDYLQSWMTDMEYCDRF